MTPLLILLAAGTINFFRPLPAPTASLTLATPAAAVTPTIDWPADGQAAIAADGYGLLGTSGSADPLATASIAKIITALCVLQKQPLAPRASGPTYTIDASDVALYQQYLAENGSLIPVQQGEKLTEYQALEALLLPSANNIADSLARWVFGGQSAYRSYATSFLQQHGLNETHIGSDASGFQPDTTSTASDLTSLGLLALKNPVLMEIAGKSTATLPVVGTVSNYDTILGQHGITGLKTGNNDVDLGAFLFTAEAQVGGKTLPLTGAVMGASSLDAALQDSSQLAASLQRGFEQLTVATAGQPVGSLQTAWGSRVPIVSQQALQVVRWKGTPVTTSHHLDLSRRSGTIGSLKVAAGRAESTVSLQLKQTVSGPSFWWRLTRH